MPIVQLPFSPLFNNDLPDETPRASGTEYFTASPSSTTQPSPPHSAEASPATPDSLKPSAEAEVPRVSSRNDLFSLDWSSSAGPNVSRSWITPPPAPSSAAAGGAKGVSVGTASTVTPRAASSSWAGHTREGWQIGSRSASAAVTPQDTRAPSPANAPDATLPTTASVFPTYFTNKQSTNSNAAQQQQQQQPDKKRPHISLTLPPSPPSPTGLGFSSLSALSYSAGPSSTTALPATPTSPDFLLPSPRSATSLGLSSVWPSTGGKGAQRRVRMQPSPEWMLGEGRHAEIYLASFTEEEPSKKGEEWTLCAAKRLFPDRESQLAGLSEAVILSKLAPSPNSPDLVEDSLASKGAAHILRLYGVQDELAGLEPIPTPAGSSNASDGGLSRRNSARYAALGHGRPPTLAHTAGARSVTSAVPTSATLPGHRKPRFGTPAEQGHARAASDSQYATLLHAGQEMRSASQSSIDTLQGPEDDSTTQEILAAPAVIHDLTPGRILLLVEHCPLGHLLAFAKSYPERLGAAQWLDWALQLSYAVGCAHERGVLHADLKPQNVLIAADLSLRLADFGMAIFLPGEEEDELVDPLGLGTAAYSPPEFVQPPPSAFGLSADVYSLGVTLSVLLSGKEPYEGLRTVERMWYVAKGAYWDWEERRRIAAIGASTVDDEDNASVNGSDYSRPASRAGSIRSNRSRAGSGGWDLLGSSTRGRDSSVESADGSRAQTALAQRGMRLLASEGQTTAQQDEEGLDSVEDRPPWAPPLLAFPVHPPALIPSPRTGSESSHGSAEQNEANTSGSSVGSATSWSSARMLSKYPDGSPLQRFLDGGESVPWEVRELLRRMTDKRREKRPEMGEVVRVLEGVRARWAEEREE